MSIRYDGEIANGIHLVTISEPLNISQSKEIKQAFQGMAGEGVGRIVIDLEAVPFIDSRGLATLVAGYRIFGSQAKNFRLTGLQDQPKLVLELTGFDYIFEIYDSMFEAVAVEVNIPVELPLGVPVFMPHLATMDLAAP